MAQPITIRGVSKTFGSGTAGVQALRPGQTVRLLGVPATAAAPEGSGS